MKRINLWITNQIIEDKLDNLLSNNINVNKYIKRLILQDIESETRYSDFKQLEIKLNYIDEHIDDSFKQVIKTSSNLSALYINRFSKLFNFKYSVFVAYHDKLNYKV